MSSTSLSKPQKKHAERPHSPAQTGSSKSGYLPSLDGWRAIAILGVMLAHDTSWALHGTLKPAWQTWGGSGVGLFFAISGILITTRILEEERLNGLFDIRGFYTRRVLRIQPAALVYLLVIAVLILAQVVHDQWHYWLGAVFMYENFLWKGYGDIPYSFFVGHFWSLAVEEHFYILLSFLLLTVRRWRLAVLVSLWVAFQIATRVADHAHIVLSDRRTYWQLEFLVLPAALAVALQNEAVRAWFVRRLTPRNVFALTLLIFVYEFLKVWHRHQHQTPTAIIQPGFVLVIRYVFPFWILATMLHPEAWPTRLLEWTPLRWIGKISYSLYLWHLLFFFRDVPATHVTAPLLVAFYGRPAKYVAAFALAALSYYIVELPCMRLGHRLAPPRRAGRPELASSSTSA